MDQTIIFSGRIRKGSSREEVRDNFSRIFKLDDPKQLDRFFSGKPVVIRRGLSEEDARKYEQFLFKAGALCEIRPSGNTSATLKALSPPKRQDDGNRFTRPRMPTFSTSTQTSTALPAYTGKERFTLQRWHVLALILLAALALLFDMQQIGLVPSDLTQLFRNNDATTATENSDADAQRTQRVETRLTLSRLASSPVASPERDAARAQMIEQAGTDQQKENLRKLYAVIDQNARTKTH